MVAYGIAGLIAAYTEGRPMNDEQVFELRLGHQDHLVLRDAMAPRFGSRSAVARTIRGVVVEGHHALANPRLAQAACHVGVAVTIGPFTPALQYEGSGLSAWRGLPYAMESAAIVDDLETDSARAQLVDMVLGHQLNCGATRLVAPYFYVRSPDDPWWQLNIRLLRDTREWMTRQALRLDLVAPLAGLAVRLGSAALVQTGIRDFARQAVLSNATAAWLMLSPLGQGDESYDKLLGVVGPRTPAPARGSRREAIRVIRSHGVGVRVARAGRYGTALVAAGATGFDAGVAGGDSIDVASTGSSLNGVGSGESDACAVTVL
jgi:hypothetical protein